MQLLLNTENFIGCPVLFHSLFSGFYKEIRLFFVQNQCPEQAADLLHTYDIILSSGPCLFMEQFLSRPAVVRPLILPFCEYSSQCPEVKFIFTMAALEDSAKRGTVPLSLLNDCVELLEGNFYFPSKRMDLLAHVAYISRYHSHAINMIGILSKQPQYRNEEDSNLLTMEFSIITGIVVGTHGSIQDLIDAASILIDCLKVIDGYPNGSPESQALKAFQFLPSFFLPLYAFIFALGGLSSMQLRTYIVERPEIYNTLLRLPIVPDFLNAFLTFKFKQAYALLKVLVRFIKTDILLAHELIETAIYASFFRLFFCTVDAATLPWIAEQLETEPAEIEPIFINLSGHPLFRNEFSFSGQRVQITPHLNFAIVKEDASHLDNIEELLIRLQRE